MPWFLALLDSRLCVWQSVYISVEMLGFVGCKEVQLDFDLPLKTNTS